MLDINKKIEALRILADAMNSCSNVPAVMILAEAWVELWREVTRIAPEAVRRASMA